MHFCTEGQLCWAFLSLLLVWNRFGHAVEWPRKGDVLTLMWRHSNDLIDPLLHKWGISGINWTANNFVAIPAHALNQSRSLNHCHTFTSLMVIIQVWSLFGYVISNTMTTRHIYLSDNKCFHREFYVGYLMYVHVNHLIFQQSIRIRHATLAIISRTNTLMPFFKVYSQQLTKSGNHGLRKGCRDLVA